MDAVSRDTGGRSPVLVRDLLLDHFSPLALEELVIARQEFPLWMRVDLQCELEDFFAEFPGHRFSGARTRGTFDFRFPNLIEGGEDGIALGPAVWTSLDVGDAEPVRCLRRGLWLADTGNMAFGLLLEFDDEGSSSTRMRVEIATPPGAASEAYAASVLRRLLAAGRMARTLRGKVLTPTPEAHVMFSDSPPDFRVQAMAPVARDEMVLAPGVLDLIERNTLGFAAQSAALAQLGMSARKGILLYGPPGTGKTLIVRYLAGALGDYTKFILGAHQMSYLGEAIQTARFVQPAMVVIEDVDLIAADRDGPWQHRPSLLNHLLNEMDGIEPDSRVLFVLTTNRPEVLEPALAGRPGRIDQAIEIGLPEDHERRILLRRYARGLEVADETVAAVCKRVGRVSPAYIKEVDRRAAQAMFERGGESLGMGDFEQALGDMTSGQGRLGVKLSGASGSVGFA